MSPSSLAIGRARLRRAPQWLALLALLVQFVATFAHFDPNDYAFLLEGSGPPALAAAHGSSPGSSQSLPDDGICPICASIQLLGSTALPDGAVLPEPCTQIEARVSAAVAELWLRPRRYLLFVTRAPPLT
jgi:hypothetical protein